MALHLRVKFLLWTLKQTRKKEVEEMEPQEARDYNEKFVRSMNPIIEYPPVEMHKVSDRFVKTPDHDIPVRVYQPFAHTKLPILLYFHGGGFVLGSLNISDRICRRLAKLTRSVVISVDYRLAPEHKFPAAPEDCYAATLWAAENAESFLGDPKRMAVMGDSAGGNLATVVCMMARDRQGPSIAYQALIYPTTDGTFSFPSVDKWAEGYLLTKNMMTWFLDQYRDVDTDPKDPYFSPFWSDNLAGLPPALILTAEYDPLIDEGLAYAEKLKAAGVPVQYKMYPGMIHAFFPLSRYLKAARQAQEWTAHELRQALGTDGLVLAEA